MLVRPLWCGEDERRSVLRRVYIYGMVLATATLTLGNASQILHFGIATLLGVAPATLGGVPVEIALGQPLANALVYGLFWLYFWRSVGREAAVQAEIGHQAGVRRVYYYLVCAIALAFVGWSTVSLLNVGIDALLQGSALGSTGARVDLARSTSWLVIGLPVWLWHWRHIQLEIGGINRIEETRATTRRWYLYLIALVSVAVLLTSGARVVYEIVLVALGRPPDRELVVNLGHALCAATVAGVVLG